MERAAVPSTVWPHVPSTCRRPPLEPGARLRRGAQRAPRGRRDINLTVQRRRAGTSPTSWRSSRRRRACGRWSLRSCRPCSATTTARTRRRACRCGRCTRACWPSCWRCARARLAGLAPGDQVFACLLKGARWPPCWRCALLRPVTPTIGFACLRSTCMLIASGWCCGWSGAGRAGRPAACRLLPLCRELQLWACLKSPRLH